MIGNNAQQDLHMQTRTPKADQLTAPLFRYADSTPMQQVDRVLMASNKVSEHFIDNVSPFIVYLRYQSPGMTPPNLSKLISNHAVLPKTGG